MSKKHSDALSKRHAKVPPEERSRIMSKVVSARHANMTKEEKTALGKALAKAKKEKHESHD